MTPLAEIREAAITALAAALDDIHVGPVRTYARGLSDLPAAEVSTPRALVRRLDGDGSREVTATLQVMLMAAGSAPEGTLSPLAETVEATLLADGPLSALVDDWRDLVVEFDAGDGAESRPAALRMTFDVVIYTPAT